MMDLSTAPAEKGEEAGMKRGRRCKYLALLLRLSRVVGAVGHLLVSDCVTSALSRDFEVLGRTRRCVVSSPRTARVLHPRPRPHARTTSFQHVDFDEILHRIVLSVIEMRRL